MVIWRYPNDHCGLLTWTLNSEESKAEAPASARYLDAGGMLSSRGTMPAHDIIVIGGSAGGVETIIELAKHLPRDLAAAAEVLRQLLSSRGDIEPLEAEQPG